MMDSIFFWSSKIAYLAIAPDNLLVFLVLGAWATIRRGAHRMGGRLLGAAAAALLAVAVLPVNEWLLYPLERQFPVNPELPASVAGILVLGGAEDRLRSAAWKQVQVNDAADRFLAAIALSRRYPEARLVFTGGSADLLHQGDKGAGVARILFHQQGLDASRITYESESRNTYENASFSKALVKPGPAEHWVLVTSASHMPRAVGSFCRTGWAVIPYPVDYLTRPGSLVRADLDLSLHLRELVRAEKEWLGLVAYYVTGKTDALVPAGCGTRSPG